MQFLYRRSVPSPDSERLCLRSRRPDERPLQRPWSRLRTGQRTSRSLNKEKTSRLQQISSLSPSEKLSLQSLSPSPPGSPPPTTRRNQKHTYGGVRPTSQCRGFPILRSTAIMIKDIFGRQCHTRGDCSRIKSALLSCIFLKSFPFH